MKTSILFSLCLGALLFALGCQSVENRIERHPDWFSQLPQEEQLAVQEHRLELGLSPEAVFFILGWPDEKREITRENENIEVWVYTRVQENWEGTHLDGYSRRSYVATNPKTGKRYLCSYFIPEYVDVYSVEKEVVSEIEFKNGKVTSISETLPKK